MSFDSVSRHLSLDSVDGPTDATTLGGMYRVTAAAPTEIELVDADTLVRSVIYAGQDETFLFIPRARYLLHSRALGGSAIAAQLVPVTAVGKLVFAIRKIAALARRGPRAILSAMTSIKRMRATTGSIVGARIAGKAGTAADLVLTRDILAPAAIPKTMRAVSIVIPTKAHVELLRACIASLSLIDDVALDIIVIDNGATAPDMLAYLAGLANRADVRVARHDIPFNFSRLCNLGAAMARHPVLCFLNDDIEARDGTWLRTMLGYLARPDTGVVGARLLYPSGDLQHAGIATNLVPGPGHPWLGLAPDEAATNPFVTTSGEVDAVTAACLIVRKGVFDAVGGFDETDFAITVNDVDLCLRVRERGLKIVYAADAVLIHKEGQTRAADDRPDQIARRQSELKTFFLRYAASARHSVFYPERLRRDSDAGISIQDDGLR